MGITTASAQASCQIAVDNIAREVKQKGGEVVVRVERDGAWGLNNSRRIDIVKFDLNPFDKTGTVNNIANDILQSLTLMKSYANNVFSRCSGTGIILFGNVNTQLFGMTDSGTLGYQKCSTDPNTIINRITSVFYGPADGDCAFVIPDF